MTAIPVLNSDVLDVAKEAGLHMVVDAFVEVAKLRDQLALCQRELAEVRRQQEEAAEMVVANDRAAVRLRQMSSRLAERLDRGEAVGGRRGWLKRRLISTMPRTEEDADLAVIRSSQLLDGAWYLRRYPEVVSTGLSPALHYLRKGAAESKNPGPAFDTRRYLAQHTIPAGTNPLIHFHANNVGTTS